MYILICGLFPIIVYELYSTICSGNIKNILNKRSLLLLISLVFYAAGYVSAKVYGAEVFTNEMILTSVNNFVNNIAKCFVGIAELFGALPSREIHVTSAFGIHYLSHMAAFLICLVIVIAVIKVTKPLSRLVKQEENIALDNIVIGMVSCIIGVNILVLILTDTTYGSETFEFRYHLISVVASFLIVGIGIGKMIDWLKKQKNKLIFTSTMIVISIIWLLSNVVFAYYYNSKNMYDTSASIVNYIEKNTDYDLVYFIGDSNSDVIEVSRVARLIESRLTIVDGPDVGLYIGWGTSNKYFQPVDNIDRMILVCLPQEYEKLEPRIQHSMSILEEFDGYIIFEVPRIMTEEEFEEHMEEIESQASEEDNDSEDNEDSEDSEEVEDSADSQED